MKLHSSFDRLFCGWDRRSSRPGSAHSTASPVGSRGFGLRRLLALTALLLALALSGDAQRAWAIGELGGSISGYVTVKGTKDGLSGIPLKLSSPKLIGGPQEVTTADDGSYTFRNLPPGTYELLVKIEGFAPIKQVGIPVNAGARSAVDVALEPATSPELNEKVTIIEKVTPILNHESAAATVPISNQQITRAPTFRQEKGVAQFTPGVSRDTDKASVRGGLGRWNRYFIDGLEVTDITTGAFGSSSALINSDSVEQFAVSVGAMDAEYNSLGLVQNMVTRSGGDKLIIDASVILQPPVFAATTRYPSQAPLYNSTLLYDNRPLPDRSFYSASLNVGGPIIKQKLWFWTSFQFNFNRLTNNIVEQPFYGITAPYDRYQDQVLYLGRVKLTWQATAKTRVTLSYSTDFNDIVNASTSSAIRGVNANNLAPEAERRVQRGGHWVGLLVDSSLTDKLLFQLQTGLFYKNYLEDSLHTLNGEPDRLTPSHALNTSDATTNNFVYLNGNRPWDSQTKWSGQLAPTLLYSSRDKFGSQHNLKAGLQFTYMYYEHNMGVAGGQRYTDSVAGLPCDPGDSRTFASCNQLEVFPDSAPVGGRPGAGYTTTAQAMNFGLFLQDKITIKRWLTIVPGMRVDLGVLYDTGGQRLQTLLGFGPRFSAIYDLLHDRTTLLKFHYGRHNDVGNAGVADFGNPTMKSLVQRWSPQRMRFETAQERGGPGTQSFDGDFSLKAPKLDEVSVGLHREIAALTVVGVDYTYRLYQNLWVNEEVNQVWDPAGTRVIGYVNGIPQRLYMATSPNDARREYHGLDLWVRGTPGSWDVVGSYTLAFLNGTVGDYFETGGYRNNRRLDPLYFGPIAGAPRHFLKGLVSYNFSFGLSVGTRLTYLTGDPLWKSFRSPDDQTYTLYRSQRGSSTGTRTNDPTTWADFRLPDSFNLDLQLGFNLKKLTGQNIDLIAMLFNVLNISIPTGVETRDGATFGQVTRRPDNMFAEVVVRYRY